MQDCKDGIGLHFIKFDFVTGDQEIQTAILVEFVYFFRRYFASYFKIIFYH